MRYMFRKHLACPVKTWSGFESDSIMFMAFCPFHLISTEHLDLCAELDGQSFQNNRLYELHKC